MHLAHWISTSHDRSEPRLRFLESQIHSTRFSSFDWQKGGFGFSEPPKPCDAGLERLAALDVEVVWARARVSALDFYLHAGFETRGDEYVDITTGLAHRDIVTFL